MTTEELWLKMESTLEPLVQKVNIIGDKVEKLESLTEKVDKLVKLPEEVEAIRTKLDTMVDINLAKILEMQTKMMEEQKIMRIEFQETFNKFWHKNEIDHKRFEYEIEKLKYGDMNCGTIS